MHNTKDNSVLFVCLYRIIPYNLLSIIMYDLSKDVRISIVKTTLRVNSKLVVISHRWVSADYFRLRNITV